jgi:hypothetical protein
MAFSAFVEMLNLRIRGVHLPTELKLPSGGEGAGKA